MHRFGYKEFTLYSPLPNNFVKLRVIPRTQNIALTFKYCFAFSFCKHGKEKTFATQKSLHVETIYGKTKCPMCQKEVTTVKGRKYCSNECYSEALRKQAKERYSKIKQISIIKKCPVCDKEFDTAKQQGKKYCSRICCNRGYTINKKPTTKKCLRCQKIFQTTRTYKKYCSRICRYKHRSILLSKKRLSIPNMATCGICKKKFNKRTNKYKGISYCSLECAL